MGDTYYRQLLGSGITQIIIGGFCTLFGICERITVYDFSITSVPCLGIWMGLWIGVTGIIGIVAKSQGRAGSSKALVGFYLGFSITSIVFAAIMIICYSLVVAFQYSGYGYNYHRNVPLAMGVLILILSIVEFGVGIWASVCCCAIGPCCNQPLQTAPAGQLIYMQPQGGVSSAAYVIVQGPDGRPVAVPAQAGGPIIQPSGTPAYSQGGAVGTTVPPHFQVSTQQQAPENQVKLPLPVGYNEQ